MVDLLIRVIAYSSQFFLREFKRITQVKRTTQAITVMNIGSWQPQAHTSLIPESAIQAALQISTETFPKQPPESVSSLHAFMQAKPEQWQTCLSQLDTEQLQQLCRFFTLAESHWKDWFGGDHNPVIWICKQLKVRGAFPDKQLSNWIKQNSENRFLPYGNPLL